MTMDNGGDKSAELPFYIPLRQGMFRRPGEIAWDTYKQSETIHGSTTLSPDFPDYIMQTDSANWQYLHPIEQITDPELHENTNSVRIHTRDGHVLSAELSSHIAKGQMMLRRRGDRFWDYYEDSDTIHGPTKVRAAYPNHVMQTDSLSEWEYLLPKEKITDSDLHENKDPVRIRTRDGHVLSAELFSHIPIGQMMFRPRGTRFWDYYEGSGTIHGPTKVRAAYPNHVMQTNSQWEYLHPKEQITDFELHKKAASAGVCKSDQLPIAA